MGCGEIAAPRRPEAKACAGETAQAVARCAFRVPSPSGWANFCRAYGAEGPPIARESDVAVRELQPKFPISNLFMNCGRGRRKKTRR
jgi:hypothetical protein